MMIAQGFLLFVVKRRAELWFETPKVLARSIMPPSPGETSARALQNSCRGIKRSAERRFASTSTGLAQGLFETVTLASLESTAGGSANGQGRGVAGGELGGTEFFFGPGIERFKPEPFRVVVKGEEVAAVALKADGLAQRFPAGGLVTGAGVGFGVGEGSGQPHR
jgi:hypothetical protein